MASTSTAAFRNAGGAFVARQGIRNAYRAGLTRDGGRRCQASWAPAEERHGESSQGHIPLPQRRRAASAQLQAAPAYPTSARDFPVAVESAEKATRPRKPLIIDPLELVGRELSSLRSNISSLLGSGHPALDTIAKYYFQTEGKHVRPLIVLLMARAVNGHSPIWTAQQNRAADQGSAATNRHVAVDQVENDMGIDEPLSPRDILNDYNPDMQGTNEGGALGASQSGFDASTASLQQLATEASEKQILPTQRRLAEITEMIHVASLLHDDVIDASEMRRGTASAPAAFGNKLSILAGDFLLARASVALARLRNNEVLELLATVIANLVEGEVMQLQPKPGPDGQLAGPVKSAFSSLWDIPGASDTTDAPSKSGKATTENDSAGPTPDMFETYLQKTYLKTASLIGKSARAAAILGGFGSDAILAKGLGEDAQRHARVVRDAAYAYGRNLGIAFQLVDDLLDFKATSAAFGKPSGGADLRLGLTTAPVLFAWQDMPHEGLGTLVARKFSGEGDVPRALDIVRRSNGLQRTSELAQHHARLAEEALLKLPPSEARDALQQLNEQIITRVK